jgi:hypothetical protein
LLIQFPGIDKSATVYSEHKSCSEGGSSEGGCSEGGSSEGGSSEGGCSEGSCSEGGSSEGGSSKGGCSEGDSGLDRFQDSETSIYSVNIRCCHITVIIG